MVSQRYSGQTALAAAVTPCSYSQGLAFPTGLLSAAESDRLQYHRRPHTRCIWPIKTWPAHLTSSVSAELILVQSSLRSYTPALWMLHAKSMHQCTFLSNSTATI